MTIAASAISQVPIGAKPPPKKKPPPKRQTTATADIVQQPEPR
jgi:hypothetical protein